MNPSEHKDNVRVPRPWQPRFGIGGLMLVMLVCCIMATGGSYFVRYLREGRQFQLAFILFTLASPLLLVVVISLFRALVAWLDRRGRRS